MLYERTWASRNGWRLLKLVKAGKRRGRAKGNWWWSTNEKRLRGIAIRRRCGCSDQRSTDYPCDECWRRQGIWLAAYLELAGRASVAGTWKAIRRAS